jgi:hypothetical protein
MINPFEELAAQLAEIKTILTNHPEAAMIQPNRTAPYNRRTMQVAKNFRAFINPLKEKAQNSIY